MMPAHAEARRAWEKKTLMRKLSATVAMAKTSRKMKMRTGLL